MTTVVADNPSTLLLLFADKFVPHSQGALSKLMGEYPCANGTKVKLMDLGLYLCAAALMSLEEKALIEIKLERKKVLGLIPTKHAMVSAKSTESVPGFEGMILKCVQSAKGAVTVEKVVEWLFDQKYVMPPNRIVDLVEADGLAAGCMEAAKPTGNVITKLVNGVHATAKPNKLAELTADAERLQTRWQAFQDRDPELFKQIIGETKATFKARSVGSDSGGGLD